MENKLLKKLNKLELEYKKLYEEIKFNYNGEDVLTLIRETKEEFLKLKD